MFIKVNCSFILYHFKVLTECWVGNLEMGSEKQIILISESSKLSINFPHMLAVKGMKIALLSIQSPDLTTSIGGREKRVPKDSYFVGDSLSVFVHCDKIKENVYVTKIPSNSSIPIKCLDIVQLKLGMGYNTIEVQNPKYHALNTESLFSLEIELCDMNGKAVKFDSGYIVIKLGLK